MVKSKLNSNVNYSEIKILNVEDRDKEVALFEIELFDIPLLIALGEEKYTYSNENIVYFPVYLIKNERVGKQIGVYELFSDDLSQSLDEDGDVDITEIDGPLLYSFVNKDYLNDFNRNDADEADEDEVEEDEEDEVEEDEVEEDEVEEDEVEEDEDEDEVSISQSLNKMNIKGKFKSLWGKVTGKKA